MKRAAPPFQTIHTEGPLLPIDLLQRLRDGSLSEGVTPESYHHHGERLNEAINRAWNAVRSAWAAFQHARERLPAADLGTSLTRERWLLPLFRELGYGRLQAASAIVLDGRSFPISHAWQHVPIHLLSFRVDLDRRTPGTSGAASASPHGLLQLLLNRSSDHLWGMVSNGLKLRLLRDNASLTRQAYVEFDLEAMMQGELYSDFVVLWLLCHQSRLEPLSAQPHDCWLERWTKLARDHGLRALDQLRDGVEAAITALGLGFLEHPANAALRDQLSSGALSAQDYYRQLLRLVYRLLFLFVAEERDLLLKPDADPETRQRYQRFYSAQRLRRLAERFKGTAHSDLYAGLRLVMGLLSAEASPEQAARLGLVPLGSFLFSPHAIPDLTSCEISNQRLLEAVRALALTYDEQAKVYRSVDYKHLGADELGSVFESLLELHPQLNVEARRFALASAAGHERKTTGSYYTPEALVQALLNSALDPIIEQALSGGGQPSSPGSFHEGKASPSSPAPFSLREEHPHPPSPSPSGRRGAAALSAPLSEESAPPQPKAPLPEESTPSQPKAPLPEGEGLGVRVPSEGLGVRVEGISAPTPEERLLSLTICDPSCGSGHFLIAAANRLAQALASLRSGDEEPSPALLQQAKRDVIRRCLYGVDLNPMAVELCKVNLWLEALEPGKPLSFLDHHIVVGNSLLGTTPALMAAGIPDEAFAPLEGDDPKCAKEAKASNRKERKGRAADGVRQYELFAPAANYGYLAQAMRALEAAPDDTPDAVRHKEAQYAALANNPEYVKARLLADAWCAAFVWEKRPNGLPPLTDRLYRQLERDPLAADLQAVREQVVALKERYQFFHWHLAFPDVFTVPEGAQHAVDERIGWHGGFDLVIGNPPWERIKIQEKEWFAERAPEVAAAANAAARKHMIEQLRQTDPTTYGDFKAALRQAEGESHFIRSSGRYPLCGRGDVNTYTIFAELSRQLIRPTGRVGLIVPSGIATDDTTKHFFQDITQSGSLLSLYDFENRQRLFPAVDSRMKFCLLTLRAPALPSSSAQPSSPGPFSLREKGRKAKAPRPEGEEFGVRTEAPLPEGEGFGVRVAPPLPEGEGFGVRVKGVRAEFAFFLHDVADLDDPERRFYLSAQDIALINPNTRTVATFRRRRDAQLTMAIYRRVPILLREDPLHNPWGIRFGTMFHMSNDSGLFRTRQQLEQRGLRLEGNRFVGAGQTYLPLYEAKLMHQFNHRWASYEADGSTREFTPAQLRDPHALVMPRYWVDAAEVEARLGTWDRGWLLGFRDITNTTNERTAIFGLIPRVAVGHKAPLAFVQADVQHTSAFLANANAFAFDYVARQKIGGTSLAFFYLKQLPVLPPQAYTEALLAFIVPRVLELTYTAWDMQAFARDLGYAGPPFTWDEERRFQLRCELDALYFHLYQLARDEVDYVMETFPIVKRKDEQAYGEYRTKRVILALYDQLAATSLLPRSTLIPRPLLPQGEGEKGKSPSP